MNRSKRNAHDALGIFLRVAENWSVILLATVLCASALFSVGRFGMAPQFTSTAVLYTLDADAVKSGGGHTDTSFARDVAYAAESQEVLTGVITEQTLYYTYREMADKIEITYPEDTHVVEITVTDKSSEKAKELADAVADATIAYVSGEMGLTAPRVLSYGFTGGKTVTVSPVKLAILGALIGFVISLLVCLYRAFSDNRVLLPGDLKVLGQEVIAVIPGEE